MNKSDCIIRLERKEEYREVEKLVREAFWNVYRPGCLEHYVLNQLRNDDAFVPELDFVMERNGQLIGQNMFMRANIKADDGRDMHDVEICQRFARRNREKIAEVLLSRTGMTGGEAFHTIHNYIDMDEMILRKGAIAAHTGEKVLIPINMRDGSVLAIGKGNPEWNYSAPHGAGRILSRTKAKSELDLEEYRKAMEGIYTTSVNEETLDEAPMAYKSLDDIIDVIKESVDVVEVLKPIYNFKAS